ncbi:CDP-alcohol phosphatidyltransferase family protein [Alkalibacterium thalassium]|uniref:Phosphatidylglycerophosphate synthase n=1 Tax=Alkalibacterium thalassium TaxID=426701 RepID=A0A1G9DBC5_9LACT|nr:CDP-alcohol phosphatidyltransferase family protein [Alkalibacterium thalassium]SDK61228.1 CDP-diacylglycerol--glycerol-3-phosphate 3-phosphatidyltransferase [Alkalibacterium thalassium]
MNAKDWFTIPNILSYFRLILIPYFVIAYMSAESQGEYVYATGILVLSGLTDAVDGFIARRFNQGTKIGQLLDPVADKLTQVAVVAVLMLKWPVFLFLFILFLVKETYMFVENIRLYKKQKTLDGSIWPGKIATIVFYFTMFIAVFFPTLTEGTVVLLVGVASIFQISALYHYSKLFRDMHSNEV